ncbi:hypothetical protein E2C01_076197 [Portunus trituberculatus]|uniref:Uncharacterized protein n=1 Tax=Portunus trituberculatus TaxID=210409 RepID=A0A5B7ICK6_PORTR|nr:hypothetical protein [Portunus trituberculatus]
MNLAPWLASLVCLAVTAQGGNQGWGSDTTTKRRTKAALTMEDTNEELPPLRFDGTLNTVNKHMEEAHKKYVEALQSIGGPRPLQDAQSYQQVEMEVLNPEMLADSSEENQVPKSPCLEGTPSFLCTVQLVPGGKRHIVARAELEDGLRVADEDYAGFSLPFCCDGKPGRMVME